MFKYHRAALALSATLLIGQSLPAVIHAAPAAVNKSNESAVKKTIANVSPILIGSGNSVRLTDVNLLTVDDGNILSYTLTYRNNTSKDLSLIDYWTRVTSSSGATFSSTMLSGDSSKKTVAAYSEASITYYAKVGSLTNIHDLKFGVIKWDFNVANYERSLGSFTIPLGYETATLSGKAKAMKINDITANAIVDNAYTYKDNSYVYVNVSLRIRNTGLKTITDPKFTYSVKTSAGQNYPLQADMIGDQFQIQPNDSKTINLVAAIPSTANLSGLQLQILQSDSADKSGAVTLPTASFLLPNNQTTAGLTQNVAKLVSINNSPASVKVSNVWKTEDGSATQLTVNITYQNKGSKSITLPKYQFVARTVDGYAIPITTNALDAVTIQPQEEKNIMLSISIPNSMNPKGVQLYMNTPAAAESSTQSQNQVSYPVAVFKIPDVNATENSIGSNYTITSDKGDYILKLTSIQKLPWVDGDIIAATINIQNNSLVKSIQIPQIQGTLKLDGVSAGANSNSVFSNSNIILGAGQNVNLYLTTQVPFNFSFSQLSLLLSQKIGEALNDLIQLSSNQSDTSIPQVNTKASYFINTTGKNAKIQTQYTQTYPGSNANTINTNLIMTNRESRQVQLSQLVAFYKTPSGQYYQATVNQSDTAVSPAGQDIVSVWSKIPSDVDPSTLTLIVGEGVTQNKMMAPKEVATGYVNGAELQLNYIKEITVSKTLKELDLFPYTLDLNISGGTIQGTSVKVEYDYKLTKDDAYTVGNYEHKLVMEVQDLTTGKVSSRELQLEKDLSIGTKLSGAVTFDNVVYDTMNSGSFYINIYDEFQGQKVLIGKQGYFYSN